MSFKQSFNFFIKQLFNQPLWGYKILYFFKFLLDLVIFCDKAALQINQIAVFTKNFLFNSGLETPSIKIPNSYSTFDIAFLAVSSLLVLLNGVYRELNLP